MLTISKHPSIATLSRVEIFFFEALWSSWTEERSQAILPQQSMKKTLLVSLLAILEHVLWICSKICFSAQKKPKWTNRLSVWAPRLATHPAAPAGFLLVLWTYSQGAWDRNEKPCCAQLPSGMGGKLLSCSMGRTELQAAARTDRSTAPPSSQNQPWPRWWHTGTPYLVKKLHFHVLFAEWKFWCNS